MRLRLLLGQSTANDATANVSVSVESNNAIAHGRFSLFSASRVNVPPRWRSGTRERHRSAVYSAPFSSFIGFPQMPHPGMPRVAHFIVRRTT